MKISACIFDLDGVIVDTAKHHYQAWRKLANKLGFDVTPKQNEELKGVSRMGSLDKILQWGCVLSGKQEKKKYAAIKNSWYVENIKNMDESEILPGVVSFLNELKSRGIKVGIGSSSKNARTILKSVKLEDVFDVIIDGTMVEKTKPNPEVFLKGAKALGLAPENIIVFEDAKSGIEAALAGDFVAVGVGEEDALPDAHLVIPGFKHITPDMLIEQLNSIALSNEI
jgi:beta-phosphoglucomutase